MDKKDCMEQQVKNKVKGYNRQRIGIAVPIVMIAAVLLLFPAFGDRAPSIRFAVCCSALLLFFSLLFVLSDRNAALLFLTATAVGAVLLADGQIQFELFLILTSINAGTLLISRKIARDFIRSATDEMEVLNRLKLEATTDCLTKLLNRNGMEQAVPVAWALCRRERKNVGFLLMDVDYFKSYNDTLGHLKGDDILKQVARSIKTCFKRETDLTGRIGGDEFLIFLTDIDDDHIVKMAQLLSSALNHLKVRACAGPCDCLSASMGIVTGIPQAGDSLMDFCNRADRALYHAKKSGRNCISYNEGIIKNDTEQSRGKAVDGVAAVGDSGFACEDSES